MLGEFAVVPRRGLFQISRSLAALFAVGLSAFAQTHGSRTAPSLVPAQVDNAQRTVLAGQVRPNVAGLPDLGPVDDGLELSLFLVLSRSAAQQADLENLIARQQQPGTPEYHHWLTPQQFGERFGVSEQDVAKVSAWLQSQGMQITGVANGAQFIQFTATAGQLRQAFGTQLRNVSAAGGIFPAASQGPSIPSALAPVVAGIVGLDKIPASSNVVNPRPASSSRLETALTSSASTQLTGVNVSPQNFYTIYDVNRVFSAAAPGLNDLAASSSVAVIEQSDMQFGTVTPGTGVATGGDVTAFRSLFNVPGSLNMHVFHGYGSITCAAPGIDPLGRGEDIEASLDAEWANATAPSANLIFMSCSPTLNNGIFTSLAAVIDNNLADTITLSYDASELIVSSSVYSLLDSLYGQAAAQGQSVFVSAGDSGSDTADQNDSGTATSGINVNALSASPLVTSAGGTDFSDYYDANGLGGPPQTNYWSNINNPYLATALGYIPEMAWGTNCADSIIARYEGYTGAGYCANSDGVFLGIIAGGGGFSTNYSVPAYQVGVPGYTGTQRAQPDISGFAASNGGLSHSLVFCDSRFSAFNCASSDAFGLAGGTSFVAPYLGGVAALLDTYTGSRQGLLNPTLYALAKTQFTASSTSGACYANGQTLNDGVTTGLPASTCIFRDVTTGNNDVPCQAGSKNCYVDSGATYGMLSLAGSASLATAYPATPGYDAATGIGSVDVYNLLTMWNTAFTSSTSLTAIPANISSSGTTLLTAGVVAASPNGYVGTAPALGGSISFAAGTLHLGSCQLSADSCTLTVGGSALASGANSITATFQGSPAYASSVSAPVIVTVGGGGGSAGPVISNISAIALAGNSALVTWTTDQPSTSQVNYGPTTVYGSSTATDNTQVTSHSVTVPNLSPNATYNFAVVSTNSSGTTTSPNNTVTITPYVGYVAFWGINNSGVTISWSTDVASTTQVAYGTTIALGQTTPLQTGLTASHGVTLSGLNSGTTYYFRTLSTAAPGNTGGSTIYSFTTTGVQTSPAPVISSVLVTNLTNTSATITWTTDQSATSQVNYGTTTSYGSSSQLNSALLTSHSVTLTNLTPGTAYDFQVLSANASGTSAASANFTFTTTGSGAQPPAITNIAETNLTSTSVTITWTTDQPSNSQVKYGISTAYGSSTTPDSNYVTSHAVTLTGLTPGTTYNFAVVSTNSAALSSTSPNQTFTTTATNATAPYVGYVAFWGINNSGITISWSTDVPANTQLAYGTSPALGQLTPVQSALTNSHGVVLTGLASGTTYYFVAQSTGANGATGYSTTYSFTTTGSPSVPAPVISNIQSTVTSTTATITWNTDEASSSQVNYGVTTNYSASSTLNPTLTTTHSVTLTNLMPGTTYDFDVMSANSNGTSATSSNSTFQTTGSASGPTITAVAAGSITSSTALITWTTNQAATSVVNYGPNTTSDPTLVTSHSITLSGLSPNITYTFSVTSVNASGVSTTSSTYSFTTSAQNASAPVISYVAFWGITSSGVTISWSTNVPSNTSVAYGTTTALTSVSPLQTALTDSHGVTLTGLLPGTTYYFRAQSADVNGNTGYSATIYTFTTLAGGPPTISNVVVHPGTGNAATIGWTTSVPTYSYVQYGTSTGNYGHYSAQTSLTTSPNCTLGYVPSGTIYYQLVSADANGNQVVSPEAIFVEP